MLLKNKGKCKFCGVELTSQYMGRHLAACQNRKDRIAEESGGAPCGYYLLRITGTEDRLYWLFLEVQAHETLDRLDQFLRDIWMECCGHTSQFIIGDKIYRREPTGHFTDMESVRMDQLFRQSLTFRYIYDDGGDNTEVQLTVAAYREGHLAGEPVKLLARNNTPEILCEHCKAAPATAAVAKYLGFPEPFLCDACIKEQDINKYDLLPLCNSPRVGVCGYSGSKLYPEELVPDVEWAPDTETAR